MATLELCFPLVVLLLQGTMWLYSWPVGFGFNVLVFWCLYLTNLNLWVYLPALFEAWGFLSLIGIPLVFLTSLTLGLFQSVLAWLV